MRTSLFRIPKRIAADFPGFDVGAAFESDFVIKLVIPVLPDDFPARITFQVRAAGQNSNSFERRNCGGTTGAKRH